MDKTKINVSFLWIGLIILSFIHLGGLQAQAYDLQDYYPLQVGDVRLYIVNITEAGQPPRIFLEREPISRTENIGGAETFIIGELEWDCWNEEYDAFAWDTDGLKMYREAECEDGQPEVINFDPPVLLTPRQFALGETKNRTVQVDGENITAEQTLEAIEDVTVYAGTFNNCLRLRSRFDFGGGDFEESVSWYAEGIGLVKEEITETEDGETETEILELAAAVVNGTLHGSPLRTWQGELFSFYLAHISTCGCDMVMDNVVIGLPGETPGLWWIRFTLDITAVPPAWTITDFGQGTTPSLDPASATACTISGLDFSQALHKINIDNINLDPQLFMRFPFGGKNYKIGFNFPPEKLSWDYYFLEECQ